MSGAMKIIRFILPFLFVRNWHDGSWEISRARMMLFMATVIFFLIGLMIAYILQAPVEYTRPV